MAWVRFSEVRDRFTHIDAELINVNVCFDGRERSASLTVRFYPWWEHPLCRTAIEAGDDWGFKFTGTPEREVTVRAVGPVAAKLRQSTRVIDWELIDDHPALWEFQQETKVFLNGPLVMNDLIERMVARRIPYVGRRELCAYLDPCAIPSVSSAVVVPDSLCTALLEELAQLGIPTFLPHQPVVEGGLQVLVLDGCDYLVAEDFLIDLPEFEHRPEWFHPAGGARDAG